jgi:hypothetical protein
MKQVGRKLTDCDDGSLSECLAQIIPLGERHLRQPWNHHACTRRSRGLVQLSSTVARALGADDFS